MRRSVFAAVFLALAGPALATQPPAAAPPAPASTPAPDPARLAAAERLVVLILPEEAMRRMLAEGIPGMDMFMDMSAEELGLGATPGLSEADRGRSFIELGNARDPHFRERTRITMRVTGEVMAEMFREVEPEFRRAYAGFFARRFTLAELNELTAFFATPTARKYSDAVLSLTQDPAFIEIMRAMMPRMLEMGPRIGERVRAATAHLPPPPPAAEDAPETPDE